MKKFHKRAAVFLTAATLAGLPAGAFFYSSPGSLTVWADNVEVESLEESSPEDVDFSDGSEVEIHADPVEQAQEDAGNDVTETPEVGITFTEPEGWQTDTATVKIQVEDTKNTGAFSIAKVEARLSENGGWSDITGNMEVSISSNCSVYVRVTDQNGNTYEQNRYIECFDKTKPTIIAAAKNGILIVQESELTSARFLSNRFCVVRLLSLRAMTSSIVSFAFLKCFFSSPRSTASVFSVICLMVSISILFMNFLY